MLNDFRADLEPGWQPAISVSGTGILVTQGGQLIDAMAPASGSLTSVTYIGKVVHKGDIIANLDDTELKSEIDRAQAVLQEREVDLGAIKSSFERQITAKTKNAIAQKANFEEIIRTDEKRRDFYRDYLAREESAVTKASFPKGRSKKRVGKWSRPSRRPAPREASCFDWMPRNSNSESGGTMRSSSRSRQ